jgi:hypothetical protein
MATSAPQGLDITELLKAAFETKQANDQATQGLVSNAGKAEAISDANVRLQETMGESAVIVQRAKDTAALETQNNRARAATDLGTNLKESSQILTSLAQTIATSYADRDAALSRIEAKRSISVLEDPLGWINAQFEINDDIRAHNVADERLANATKYYADANALTQTAVATQNAIDQPLTQASVDAASQATAAAAQVKANQERERGLIYNNEGIKAALQGATTGFSLAQSEFSARKAEESSKLALAHLAMERERFNWQKEEKLTAKGADTYLIDKINAGIKLRLGDSAELIAPGTTRANTVLSLLKSNSPAGKQFQEDYMIGDQSAVAGTKVLAPSPARAIEILNTMPVKLSPAQEPVRALLEEARSIVATAIDSGQIDGKNQAARNEALNKTAQKLLNDQAKKINSPDNVFNVPSVRALITNSPLVAELGITKKILGPLAAAGSDLSDPNQVFGLVAQALTDKKISYPEALELATIYRTGVAVNMEARQLPALGMAPKWSYNVSVTTNPVTAFGGKEVVDLSKPDSVGRALNKYLAKQASMVFDTNVANEGISIPEGFQGSGKPYFGPEITYPPASGSIYGGKR